MRARSFAEKWIEKTKRLYCRLLSLGPTDKEWEELEQVRADEEAEMQREWEEEARAYREFLAECEAEEAGRERENEEYERLKKEWDEQDAEREDRLAEQERQDQEWFEEQERYRSECPWCGSPKRHGRCPACVRAFGHD